MISIIFLLIWEEFSGHMLLTFGARASRLHPIIPYAICWIHLICCWPNVYFNYSFCLFIFTCPPIREQHNKCVTVIGSDYPDEPGCLMFVSPVGPTLPTAPAKYWSERLHLHTSRWPLIHNRLHIFRRRLFDKNNHSNELKQLRQSFAGFSKLANAISISSSSFFYVLLPDVFKLQ